ncbi:Aminopeptidase, partial [Gryllus bimaculatus]
MGAVRWRMFNGCFFRVCRGGSVVRMFANILGENKFQTALRNYLKDNALTAVTPKELFDALSKAAGNVGLPSNVELTDIFESWTTSTGFPIINVLRKESKVIFTQERFLPYGSSSKHTYNVPLKLVYNDTKLSEKSIWFLSSQKEVSIEIADIGSENASWILVPTTGYFRVNYDEDNWLLLSEYLQDESLDDIAIEPLERAILIDNALNLARISKLEYSTAIQLLSYLSNEVDYIPWTVAFSGLNYLHRMLADESDIFDNFILHIIKNVYEELGFKVVDKNDDASHIEHVHRANVLNWACRAGHSECINTAVDYLRKYLEKPQSD